MLRRVAEIEGRPLSIVPVPLLSPGLSSHWLAFVTDVDTQTGRSLVDSMANEVVVSDDSIRSARRVRADGLRRGGACGPDEHKQQRKPGDAAAHGPGGARAGRVTGRLPMPITHVVPIEHVESADVIRRRRRVVARCLAAGHRPARRVAVDEARIQAVLRAHRCVAGDWTAGGLLSGPLHLGWIQRRDQNLRRPIITPIATGVGAFGFFYACALVAREIPVLDRAIRTSWCSPRRATIRSCC